MLDRLSLYFLIFGFVMGMILTSAGITLFEWQWWLSLASMAALCMMIAKDLDK